MFFFFSSRRRHTRLTCDWSSDVCSSDLLGSIAAQRVATAAAGRTDAGVHATSQIVHFDADADRPSSAWVRGVNGLLPKVAAILWAQPVADDFHARFAATARHYTYLLLARS